MSVQILSPKRKFINRNRICVLCVLPTKWNRQCVPVLQMPISMCSQICTIDVKAMRKCLNLINLMLRRLHGLCINFPTTGQGSHHNVIQYVVWNIYADTWTELLRSSYTLAADAIWIVGDMSCSWDRFIDVFIWVLQSIPTRHQSIVSCFPYSQKRIRITYIPFDAHYFQRSTLLKLDAVINGRHSIFLYFWIWDKFLGRLLANILTSNGTHYLPRRMENVLRASSIIFVAT